MSTDSTNQLITTCATCQRVVYETHVDRARNCLFCRPADVELPSTVELITDKAVIEAALADIED